MQAGNDSSSRPFYEELADRSGACYLPLRHLDVITDMFMAGTFILLLAGNNLR